jgi:hypothetical protein
MRRLIILEKNVQKINDEPIKPVSIGRVCPKNPRQERGEASQIRVVSFSYRLISVNNRTRKQAKRIIILKEGAE